MNEWNLDLTIFKARFVGMSRSHVMYAASSESCLMKGFMPIFNNTSISFEFRNPYSIFYTPLGIKAVCDLRAWIFTSALTVTSPPPSSSSSSGSSSPRSTPIFFGEFSPGSSAGLLQDRDPPWPIAMHLRNALSLGAGIRWDHTV